MVDFDKFFNENKDKLIEIYWNDIISTYSKGVGLSKILLKELEKDEYFQPLKNYFTDINKSIDIYMESIINPTYQIAIVGAIKAGKSTLINALIGHNLASTNVTPETATLTKFRYSKSNSLKIKFYTSAEWNEIWEEAHTKKAEIFLDEYKELNADEIKNYLLDKKEIYQEFTTIDEMKEDIQKWTSSQKKEHYFVKELEIGLSDLNLPEQICLVDTPGLDDVIDYRSKITRDYIDSANAVLVCVNAKTLRNEEMVTISKTFSKSRYKKNKVYILGTQIDTMNSLEDWLIQRKSWLHHLKGSEYCESIENAEKQLVGISSFVYSKAIGITDSITKSDILDLNKYHVLAVKETLKYIDLVDQGKFTQEMINELKEKLIDYSKIEVLKNIIQNELLKDFNTAMIIDFAENYKVIKSDISRFKTQHRETLEEKRKEIKMSSDEISKRIEAEKEKIARIEHINCELEKKINETTKTLNIDFSDLTENFNNLKTQIKNMKIE